MFGLLLGACLVGSAIAADAGDDLSNNLFSDLAPYVLYILFRVRVSSAYLLCTSYTWSMWLTVDFGHQLPRLLALFGEKVTTQFMSQSTGWADNVLLAMVPLRIVTVIVGAIRVGGPKWLRAIIGRARESRATVEAELMSSTSQEVCELWNGQEIVRVMGTGPIREFIILFPDDDAVDEKGGSGKVSDVRVMELNHDKERDEKDKGTENDSSYESEDDESRDVYLESYGKRSVDPYTHLLFP